MINGYKSEASIGDPFVIDLYFYLKTDILADIDYMR